MNGVSENLIILENIFFNYGNTAVLEDVSFAVKKGDYIGVIGPNGGGKTTLLKIILGLLQPGAGKIILFGKDGGRLGAERAKLGYVPQRLSQLDSNFPATVYEIIKSGRTAKLGPLRHFGNDDALQIEKAMEIADVSKFRRRMFNDLSGGERQRVMIARALAGDPQILILDEPTTGVDIASQEQFYHFLAELNHLYGLTVLFVSHDIDIVANEVHSLLLLNKKVICFGPAKDLINADYLSQLYGGKANFTFHKH